MEKLKKWNEFVQQQVTPMVQNKDDFVIGDLVNKSLSRDPQFVSKASMLDPIKKMDLITKKSTDVLTNNPAQKVDINKLNQRFAQVIGFDMQKAMNKNVPNV